MKYHYIYKITNTLNGMIYIGKHSTENLDDGYMGSGTKLLHDQEKIGMQYFKKEILEYFDTEEQALEREKEIVDENFLHRKDTYNMTLGGAGSWKHNNNNNTGFVICRVKGHNKFRKIPKKEYYDNKEKYELTNGMAGKVYCRIKGTNKTIIIPVEEYHQNKEKYERSTTKNYMTCKDKEGNYYFVSKDDERVLNGELVHMWTGRKHTEETKRKIGEKSSIHQKGEKNSQYGTCWIYNTSLKQCIKIKKEELQTYIQEGWIKGRKMKFNQND